MKEWIKELNNLKACDEALEWCEGYDSLQEAWGNCDRGDWMLWLAGRLSGNPETASRKKLVLATCECARLALPYVAEGETRPLKAIETAEQWARGENNVTLAQVRAAGANATDAAVDAAVYVADVYAVNAAYAARAAAFATAFAAATYAYTAAAAAAARKETIKQCADIARKHYPVAPS